MKARHDFNKAKQLVLDLEAESGEEALVLQEVWVDYVLVPVAMLGPTVFRFVATPVTDLGQELGIKIMRSNKSSPGEKATEAQA